MGKDPVPVQFSTAMRFTEPEKAEIYNALNDRINSLKEAISEGGGTQNRVLDALRGSLARCEKLVEVFE